MRNCILLIFLFISSSLIAQNTVGKIKVRKKSSKDICLNGYTDGVIKPQFICGGKGLYITNSERYTITSFVILVETVKDVEMRITGNKVEGEICETIDYLKTGDVVYVNKIMAMDKQTGKEVAMPPLKFTIQRGNIDDRKQRYEVLNGNN